MYANPITNSAIDYAIMETHLDELFINNLNEEIDKLLLDEKRIDAKDRLVGQIVRGEQLSLSRKIKIFDKAYKLGEIMAEKYVNEYFTTKISCSTNIYKAAECVDLWTVHQFAGKLQSYSYSCFRSDRVIIYLLDKSSSKYMRISLLEIYTQLQARKMDVQLL